MPDFGIFRGFNSKLFGDKLFAGQLPTQLGKIGSEAFGFLLDVYPNAAAAYSLRKLRNEYTGSTIRVRRSSDNAEQDIGFAISGDLDTSSLTSFCGSGNGFVTTWYDQSGNAKNATQTTAANQPQIVSSGNIILNNAKPSLQFDGSNDRMGFTDITGVSGLTLIAVLNYNFISNDSTIFEGTDIVTAYRGSFVRDASLGGRVGYAQIYFEDGTSRFLQGSAITLNTQYLQFGYISTLGTGISVNGVLTTGTGAVNNCFVGYIANDPTIGASKYFNGKTNELIIYTSNESSNRIGIESNINSYYGIY